jgi:hypothetical protein
MQQGSVVIIPEPTALLMLALEFFHNLWIEETAFYVQFGWGIAMAFGKAVRCPLRLGHDDF